MSETENPKIYSITELTKEIHNLLEERFDFVWVEGEISNFSSPASGHYYMVLKDEAAQIRVVMFRLQARYLKFLPENGMKVIAQGRIGVYAPRGEYQIILDYLEPMGVGALALAFEQVKNKLSAQGVFDKNIKKPLPFLPQRVSVITSPTGAAVRDFLKIIQRRFANIDITIIPVRVQGDGATEDMIKALAYVNAKLDADVIVLTRGGGSLEDLWAFNREELALAIRRSQIPVLSAVGHEIDLTICDLAADFRAPTPSAAAELLVAEKESLVNRLTEIGNRLVERIRFRINSHRLELDRLGQRVKDPLKPLAFNRMRLDEIHARLVTLIGLTLLEGQRRLKTECRGLLLYSPKHMIDNIGHRLDFHKNALCRAAARLLEDKRVALSMLDKRMRDLGPMSVLKRGYSITRRLPEQTVLKEASAAHTGDRVQVLLSEGNLTCRVEKVAPGEDPL